jgi:hypothetical protein
MDEEEEQRTESPVGVRDSLEIHLVGPTTAPTWKDQWNRMIRWKADLDRTYCGRSDGLGTEDALDHALAFFVACFHLGDWLQHDGFTGARAYAKSDPALRVCRDLANGHKHLVLDRSASAPDTAVSDRSVTNTDAGGEGRA